jgi:hypothetical protein
LVALGNLEQTTLLNTVDVVLHWVATFTWRGTAAIIRQLTKVYERGVKLTKAAFRPIAAGLQRTPGLDKWSVSIAPK